MTLQATQPRILFVTPVSPFANSSGSEQRSAMMLEALSQLGQVDVLILKHGEQTKVISASQSGQAHVLAVVAGSGLSFSRYRPKPALTNSIAHALGCPMQGYQLIVGRYVWPLCQLAVPHSVPLLADLDDFHYRYSPFSPWTLASAKERLVKAVTHRMVRRQLGRFTGAFAVSAQDQHEIEAISTLRTVFLPNVPFGAAPALTPVPANHNILFVGSLWYRPNADGINWFLKHVWPLVRAQEPRASLTLAGAAPAHVRAAWSTKPGVTAPGFVDDLAATYQQSRVVVVPLQSGGGTNIKVLEALSHARPCLVTQFVARAFEGCLAKDTELLVAGNAQDYATQLIASLALTNQDKTLAAAKAGHSAANMFFSRPLFRSRVAEFAQTLLAPWPPSDSHT
jgi:glycosyltransferase involved in cell wall biosynthesis